MDKKATVLMILDGYGLSDKHEHNAIYEAKTPVMDSLILKYPHTKLKASGLAVGLPEGQMGNSEVGHLNIGAGRIIYQDLTKITKAIEDGDFFKNAHLLSATNNCKKSGSSLHIFGLLSDGGVHSHNSHLYALLRLAKEQGLRNVYVHCFLDGRDTPPTSGKMYIEQLENKINEIGIGKIGVITGRYYAMDRDTNWDRVKKAYDALTLGIGDHYGDALSAAQKSYDNGITDEFMLPSVICDDALIKDNDSVIFYNFRPDRARELTRAFCDPDFKGFDRKVWPKVKYVCFTDYDETIPNKEVAFKKEEPKNTFAEFISSIGMTQLHIAETEKYAHVTFFFNGGVEKPYKGEDRILIPSPKVATYDLKPEMSAYEVCDELCKAIRKCKYDVIIINFANSDMVGHTGVEEAAIAAVEAVDECIGKTVSAIKDTGAVLFICADHGNSEQMLDEATKEPHTAHTTNPVPFVMVNAGPSLGLKDGGRLCDIVPTMIDLMGLKKPLEMTGVSLLDRPLA